jgi:hypothetical protein
MKLQATDIRIIRAGRPCERLWRVLDSEQLQGALVWPKRGIRGNILFLIEKRAAEMRAKGDIGGALGAGMWSPVATGFVTPDNIDAIEVKGKIVHNSGWTRLPDGFTAEDRIVALSDGTQTLMRIAIGPELEIDDTMKPTAVGATA